MDWIAQLGNSGGTLNLPDQAWRNIAALLLSGLGTFCLALGAHFLRKCPRRLDFGHLGSLSGR